MKKTNNKFRNNNNNFNTIYSLNYKFDSTSIAGKTCGTALDLIKKYNELAKDAHANNDYVTAEVFRQYAEHYRKIVTEINERKQQNQPQSQNNNQSVAENVTPDSTNNANKEIAAKQTDSVAEIIPITNMAPVMPISDEVVSTEAPAEKKSFKVIEISAADSKSELINESETSTAKPRRTFKKKTAAAV